MLRRCIHNYEPLSVTLVVCEGLNCFPHCVDFGLMWLVNIKAEAATLRVRLTSLTPVWSLLFPEKPQFCYAMNYSYPFWERVSVLFGQQTSPYTPLPVL